MSTNTDNIKSIVSGAGTLGLTDTEKVKFLKRKDTKYTFHKDKLPGLLNDLAALYKILSINNQSVQRYNTLYYDTHGLRMYLSHHNGNRPRFKIRTRHYLTTNDFFLEVKKKNNKNITSKKRIPVTSLDIGINDPIQKDFIKTKSPYNIDDLKKVLETTFSRITFISINPPERITVDFDLEFKSFTPAAGIDKKSFNVSNLCIIETKGDAMSKNPLLSDVLKKHIIYKMGFSKYCMGLVISNMDIKKNCFKPRIITFKKNNIIF